MTLQYLTRRRLLKALIVGSSAAFSLPSLASTPKSKNKTTAITAVPLKARRESFEENLWGSIIKDPYRWMENRNDPEYDLFLKSQNSYAEAILESIPGRNALQKRVSSLSGSIERVRNIYISDEFIFYQKRPLGSETYKLYFRPQKGGSETVLFNPSQPQKATLKDSLIEWASPSPNGLYVALGTSRSDSERITLNVIETKTRRIITEDLLDADNSSPSWLPDSSGFFYVKFSDREKSSEAEYLLNSKCKLHKINTNFSNDSIVLARGLYDNFTGQPEEFPYIVATLNSDRVIGAFQGGVRKENSYYIASLSELLAGHPKWTKLCDLSDEVTGIAISGDYIYFCTTKDSPNGKVVRTDIQRPNIATAKIAAPESEVIIENILSAKDGLYLLISREGYNSLQKLDHNGSLKNIDLPFEGTIDNTYADNSRSDIWFTGESWLLPQQTYRIKSIAEPAQTVSLIKRTSLDFSPYKVTRDYAISRDGVKIPISIVARKNIKYNSSNPTLVDAYGAYQYSSQPWNFNGRLLAFLEKGGVYVTAHVRGGGEYGRKWWLAGYKETKSNTWRDLIDCCKKLYIDGWSSPKHLAITGTSAGGIAVGMAMVEEAELFTAVISNVGVSNPLRAEFSPTGPANIDEFGTVTEYKGFVNLRKMDAYQSIREGKAYPAVLLTTGVNDSRVPPWEVMKMTAQLQHATSSGKPVLLTVDFDGGHGLAITRSQADTRWTNEFAFTLWQTGHPEFQIRHH